MKQETTAVRDCFIDLVNYVSKQEDIYDPETYKQSSMMSGKAFDEECRINYTYVAGTAFAAGFIGNTRFRLWYNHLQGFQMQMVRQPEELAKENGERVSCVPHNLDKMLEQLKSRNW